MNDLINGLFEILGMFFICPSIIKLYREKEVRGISYVHASYFFVWGVWNLYFYPSLGQTWSFIGAIGIVIANFIWVCQLLYYRRG